MANSFINALIRGEYKGKDKLKTKDKQEAQRVKNAILNVCDNNIHDASQTLVFEAYSKELPYVIQVINEEPIISKYDIVQVSNTLFQARRKSLDIFD